MRTALRWQASLSQPMKRNFVLQLHCQNDNVISLVKSLFLLDIFNFIRYTNYTIYDITVAQNNFSKLIVNLQSDRLHEHKNEKTKRLIVVYACTAHF